MCVQCVMGAAAGFGIFQTYRYVIKDRARKLLGSPASPPPAEATVHAAPTGAAPPLTLPAEATP